MVEEVGLRELFARVFFKVEKNNIMLESEKMMTRSEMGELLKQCS